jgi:radical SAM superfamily enzyme YgiQ (UPF0313 family)
MKILLIAPASGKWRKVARTGLFNGKTFRFSLLSLLSVAAVTPADAEVQIVDEQVDDIPWEADVDLVGITCMTALAPWAYEISARFRKRGVPVVLGGMHSTLLPEEALRNATAIVKGEAESVWPRVVEDARKGTLSGVYRNNGSCSLKGLKPPPRHLLPSEKYSTVYAIQATRGCPHGCEFCAVSAFSGKTQHRRPVEEVAAEVAKIPDRFVLFVDDNLTADREYAARLFEALTPLKKHWASQSTLAIADDPEFVRLAAASGCIGLFVGLETFSEKNLTSVGKSCHRVADYRKSIQCFHDNGIAVEAGIVFGFDGDGPDVFESTLKVLDRLGVDAIQVSILTPLPGTPAYEKMRRRITVRDWSKYDFHHPVFTPSNMTPDQLQAGHDWATHQFYRPRRILWRMLRHLKRPRGRETLKYILALNLAYYGRIHSWRIRGWNPGRDRFQAGMGWKKHFQPQDQWQKALSCLITKQ